MIELSVERITKILQEETAQSKDLPTIVRAIYTRYLHMYENYFADIDALNDEKIAEWRAYYEETKSLVKYYYLDIPLDICTGLETFDEEYNDELLGPDWHKNLFDHYKEFKQDHWGRNKSEEDMKAEFAKHTLSGFYDAMDYIFRDKLGTNSDSWKDMEGGLKGLLFGGDK